VRLRRPRKTNKRPRSILTGYQERGAGLRSLLLLVARGVGAVKFVVGLGNPGPEYDGSRHNLGCDAVRLLASRLGCPRFRRGYRGLLTRTAAGGQGPGRSGDVVLLLPTTYMNSSGIAVRVLLQGCSWSPDDLVVVHDDLDLASGRLKLRRGGSSGGHRGVESIIDELGTDAFVRVKIGIGRPPAGTDPMDYVLQRPPSDEEDRLSKAADRAAEAIETVLALGLDAAMNRYNRAPDGPGPGDQTGRSTTGDRTGGCDTADPAAETGSATGDEAVSPQRGSGRATAR